VRRRGGRRLLASGAGKRGHLGTHWLKFVRSFRTIHNAPSAHGRVSVGRRPPHCPHASASPALGTSVRSSAPPLSAARVAGFATVTGRSRLSLNSPHSTWPTATLRAYVLPPCEPRRRSRKWRSADAECAIIHGIALFSFAGEPEQRWGGTGGDGREAHRRRPSPFPRRPQQQLLELDSRRRSRAGAGGRRLS